MASYFQVVQSAREAIAALDEADLMRLGQTARLLWPTEPEDLLQEAVKRLWDGTRRWKPDVGIYPYLRETMRSIASSWAKERRSKRVLLESEVPEGTWGSLVDTHHSDPEKCAAAREELEALRTSLSEKGHNIENQIMELWADEMQGAAVWNTLGIDEKRYRASVRRIRRAAARLPRVRDQRHG